MTDGTLVLTQCPELSRRFAALNRALLARWIERLTVKGASPNTIDCYGRAIRHFLEFLDSHTVLLVQHSDLLIYLTKLFDQGLQKNTMRFHVMALRNFGRYLQFIEIPNSGALTRLKAPKQPVRVGEFFDAEQIQQLVAATHTPRERALIEMAFGTGARVSELARIRLEDVQWDDVSTVVVVAKGDREHKLYFGSKANQAVLDYVGDRREGFLFRREHRCWKTLRPPVPRHRSDMPRPRTRAILAREWHSFWTGRNGQRRHAVLVANCSQEEAETQFQEIADSESWQPPAHLYVARPNKSIPTDYWKTAWVEYDDSGRPVKRHRWLGMVSKSTRSEAEAKATEFLVGKILRKKISPRARLVTVREPKLAVQKSKAGPRRVELPILDKPLGRRQLHRIIADVGHRANMHAYPHKLRHSAASAMLNGGAGIREVCDFLGHVSLISTQRYLHSSPVDLVREWRKYHPHSENEKENSNG